MNSFTKAVIALFACTEAIKIDSVGQADAAADSLADLTTISTSLALGLAYNNIANAEENQLDSFLGTNMGQNGDCKNWGNDGCRD